MSPNNNINIESKQGSSSKSEYTPRALFRTNSLIYRNIMRLGCPTRKTRLTRNDRKKHTQSVMVGRLQIEPELCDVIVSVEWAAVFTFLLEGSEI